MRKNWLKLALGMTAVVSLAAGASLLNNNIIDANAEVVAQDITDLDMCNNAKPGDDGNATVGSDSAFNFSTPQAVATGDHNIHMEGENYWKYDTVTKYFNISFQMEFGDWGDNGWFGFNTAGSNQLRIYNHKIETKALVGTAYEGRHQEQAFETEITSGWHTVNMILDCDSETSSSGHNTFIVKVIIDGVETGYSWFAEDWGGSAFVLVNKTGTTVNVRSSKTEDLGGDSEEPEQSEQPNENITYNEVESVDIASMLISDDAIGNAGDATAFSFQTGDSVTAEANRIHVAGSGYWSWDTVTKEMSVDFKMEFADWGSSGWFGFCLADNTELRIYNNKIEIYAGGASKGMKAFAEKIISDWHLLNVTYQYGKSESGAVIGSRLIVTIDSVAYAVSSTYYTTSAGNAYMLINKTGVAVNIISSLTLAPDEEPEGEMTYTDVPAWDIADIDISDGALGSVQNPFNFNEVDEVSAEENRVHIKGQNHYQWDTTTRELNVDFNLEFTEWNGGWFGFRTASQTELRIFNDKIEIYADGTSKGIAKFDKEINVGWHTVNMTYQFRSSMEDGAVNGSRLIVTIDGVNYEIKTNYYPTYQGHAVALMNMTGDPVNVLSSRQILPEITYTKVKKQQITDLFIANGDTAFNFNNIENVSVGTYGIFLSDSFNTEDTSLGKDITFKAKFSYWNDGYIGFQFSNVSVRIYNEKIAIYSRNNKGEYLNEEALTELTSPVYSGWHILRITYQNKYEKGVAVGSRLQVTIDGTVYVTECSYINEIGTMCRLVNATKSVVEITSQDKVTLKDLSEWWIINNALRNNGYTYQAGAENAFNFLFEESVAKGAHIFHDQPSYWSIAITYSTGGFEFIMSFDGWNKAWTLDDDGNLIKEDGHFDIRIGTTIVRIYVDRAELCSSVDQGETYAVKDTVKFGKTYSGMQDVTVLIEKSEIGTKASLTIAGEAYVLESDIEPATSQSYLQNNTGTTVKIQSLLKKKMKDFVESYLDYDNYYDREIEEAYSLIEKALSKVETASARSNIDTFVAVLCQKLDLLPTRAEVDAMVQSNAEYKNTIAVKIETKVNSLSKDDFTAAQWDYILEVKQNALLDLNQARSAEETDSINEMFLAEVQLVVEDASKLAFYLDDIAKKLEEAADGSEIEKILQETLVVIQKADFAAECEDTYLAAVQAVEGNGRNEVVPDEDLQGGGELEKVEDGNVSSDSSSGCGSVINFSSSIIIMLMALFFYFVRRKSNNECDV